MANINTAGVVKGGLLAGLIINIGETILNTVVVASRMQAELATRGLQPPATITIMVFVAMCFGLGLFLVWLYAAIRPRLGAGPKTAVCAGLIVWGLAWFWPALGSALMGIYSPGLLAISTVWGLGELVWASVAGAYVYNE